MKTAKTDNYEKGRRGELLAADYLSEKGFRILERNYRFHRNEVDLIAVEDGCLVFLEVKERQSPKYGYGFEAVTAAKQSLIRRVAEHYLLENPCYQNHPCRFDVISIDGGKITYFKNAF